MFQFGTFSFLTQERPALKGGSFFIRVLVFGLGSLGLASALIAATEIVVAAYNLENYSLNDSEHTRKKPIQAREAVAEVVAEVKPDVLGVCEVGSLEALEDLRERLQKRGLLMPYFEYVDGPDPERHVALLSRFPIVRRQSLTRIPFELNGSPEIVRRGFLDVTVQVDPRFPLRLIGVHLKSKLPSLSDENLVRRMEALCLRTLVDRVLGETPSMHLIVYGDFNDTKEEASIRGVLGARNGLNNLSALPAQDPSGDRWTYYRFFTDVYARIDYLMTNRALHSAFISGSARVSNSPHWRKASDHRMIYASFRFGEH